MGDLEARLEAVLHAYRRDDDERTFFAALCRTRASRRCFVEGGVSQASGEVRVLRDEHRELQTQHDSLRGAVERARSEGEALCRRAAEDRTKVRTLEKLVGPTLDTVVYERGAAPVVLGARGGGGAPAATAAGAAAASAGAVASMSIKGHLRRSSKPALQRVALPVYKDRTLEEDVERLGAEADALMARFYAEHAGHEAALAREQDAFDTEHAGLLDAADALVQALAHKMSVATTLQEQACLYRTDGMTAERALLHRKEALQAELAEVRADVRAERKTRAKEMTAVIRDTKAAVAQDTARLQKESLTTAREAKLLAKQAEEQRKRYASFFFSVLSFVLSDNVRQRFASTQGRRED